MYLEGNKKNCHFFPVSLYVKLFQFETFRHITCLLFVEILCFFAIALYRAAVFEYLEQLFRDIVFNISDIDTRELIKDESLSNLLKIFAF